MMILSLFFTIFIQATETHPRVHLSIGETYKLKSQPLETLRVQKKGIISIKDEGEIIILTGKKLGVTRVQLGDKTWFFEVLHKYDQKTLEQLKSWQKGKRGPSTKVVDGKVEVQGRLLRIDDFLQLESFTNSQSKFRISTSMDPNLKQQVLDEIQGRLQVNNLQKGEISFKPHWTYRIPSQWKESLGLYKKVLSPFGIQVYLDSQNLTSNPVIEIKLYISHVKKSWMRQWGMQWPSQLDLQLVSGSPLQWGQLQASLHALEASGQGKILASPTLMVESGREGEFHSGGEIPIRTTTQFNNVVQWKRYGLFLKAKPKTNAQGHLHFEINLEMSSLDHSQSSEGTPALQRSEVKTHVHMKQAQPFFLSGFLQQGRGKIKSGLPWLQQIPIFAPLFSTKQIYDDDYELIFIMVPKFYGK